MTTSSPTFDRSDPLSGAVEARTAPAGPQGVLAGGQARTPSAPTDTGGSSEAARPVGASRARHSRPTPEPNGTGASGGTRARRNR